MAGQETTSNKFARVFTTSSRNKNDVPATRGITKSLLVYASPLDSDCKKKVRVLLDSGSNRSLCRRLVPRFLGVKGDVTDLCVQVATGLTTKTTREEQVWLRLSKLDGKFSIPVSLTTSQCIGDVDPIKFNPREYEHLRQLEFTETFPTKRSMAVDVLLGEPYYSHLLKGTPILGTLQEPGGQVTSLGACLCAADPTGNSPNPTSFTIKHTERPSLLEISQTMKKFFDLETIGVTAPNVKTCKYTAEEQDAIQRFHEGAKFDPKTRRWTVELPWKNERPSDNNGELGNNYSRAVARMVQHEQRTKEEDRDNVIAAYRELMERGWAEKVPEDEKFPSDRATYVLITRPVIDYSRLTTKVRIIMDAGAKDARSGKSLNDLLHQGPTLLPKIPHVIMRFRRGRWAFTLDITKQFFNIQVPKEDVEFLRFVFRDYDVTRAPDIYRMLVYVFGLKPSPFVAIYCILLLADMYKLEFIEAVEILRDQLYMDDVPASCDSKETARHIVRDLKELLSRGSFKAHKFASNNVEILADLEDGDKLLDEDIKVLGIRWNRKEDVFGLNFDSKILVGDKCTKRLLMSQAAQLFDVCGWVQPFILQYKIMLQRVWMLENEKRSPRKKGDKPHKIEYDVEIEGDIKESWLRWKEDIPKVKQVKLKRWTGQCDNSKVTLAVFGDASEQAYGCVAYLIVQNGDKFHTTLQMSKSRLPPDELKPKNQTEKDERLTIVRLELLAAVLAKNLGTDLADALTLPRSNVHYFTDSCVNLLRLQQGPKPYKVWVANRVADILDNTNAENWHFTPGQDNPADLASRGCNMDDLLKSEVWWHGPKWLSGPKSQWPQQPILRKTPEERLAEEAERKKDDEGPIYIYATREMKSHPVSTFNKQFEKYSMILYVLAWWKRLVQNWKRRLNGEDLILDINLTRSELQEAEVLIVKTVQKCCFADELSRLHEGNEVAKNSKLRDLNPSLNEDGLIVHNSRILLQESDPHSVARPPILPKHHRIDGKKSGECGLCCNIVTKLILHHHVRNLHCSFNTTRLHVRRRYFILGGASTIRKALYTCKQRNCRPVANVALQMGRLPLERSDVGTLECFKNVAMDYLGPFRVSHRCDKDKCPHGVEKAYILLSTCFLSRAIHLEVTRDLTTEEWLNAFRRLVARRGKPQLLYSDNATTFRAGDKELKTALKRLDTRRLSHELLSQHGCEWKFSKAKSPWENGLSERLVQSVKRALRKILGSCTLTFDGFVTTIIEIEAIINDRPLATIDDAQMLPITPAQLVAGRPLTALADPPNSKDVNEQLDFPQMWWKRRLMLNGFWKRWNHDYLLQLSPLRKWKRSDEDLLNIGDVVVIREHDAPRNTWKIARILELYKNQRGYVTSVKLKTPHGRPIHRSVRNVALLEKDQTIKGPSSNVATQHHQVVHEMT